MRQDLLKRSRRKIQKRIKEKGQISVMIGIMISTFILFFAFVLNVGMLVNAKINLQNAADLAAYAGAAVQARQLTQISYLNYEMRRQWKKLLFRIYVLGNMAQDGFPRSAPGTGSTPMKYIPNNNDPNTNYQIPATCVIFNSNDNFCHLSQLPAISIPNNGAPTYLDSIQDTLIGELQGIETIRLKNCQAIGQTNQLLNFFWLYNGDPNLAFTGLDNLSPDQLNALQVVGTLVAGLGIVPREVLLRLRINTMNDYVNAVQQKGITLSGIQALQQSPDPALYERSIQAFYSAYYTLGNHTYDGSTITMDELLPGDGTNSSLLLLKDIKTAFDTYAVNLTIGSDPTNPDFNGSTVVTGAGSPCNATLVPISVSENLPLGVAKDPTVLTYYAIRMTATAKLLFSPFGDLTMKAYAAAQPFGSRIGPIADPTNYVEAAQNPRGAAGVGYIPNVAVREQDSANTGSGWDTEEVLGSMFAAFQAPTSGGGFATPATLGQSALDLAYFTAMSPNPWEAIRYNIINDEGPDSFQRSFFVSGSNLEAAFWAPVISPAQTSNAAQTIKNAFDTLFNDDNTQGNQGSSANPLQQIRDTVTKQFNTYVTTNLMNGQGENGEGMNIVRLTSPLRTLLGSSTPTLPKGASQFYLTDPMIFKTSWNTVNDGNLRAEGRVGYSVKFVSFDSLTQNKLSTNGSDGAWGNALNTDDEASTDIPFIKH